jgi:hypothetical protein
MTTAWRAGWRPGPGSPRPSGGPSAPPGTVPSPRWHVQAERVRRRSDGRCAMPVAGVLDLLRGSADGQLRRSGHRRVLAGSRPRTIGPREWLRRFDGTPAWRSRGRDAPGDGMPSRSRRRRTSSRTRQNRRRPRSRWQGDTLHLCPRILPDAHSVTIRAAGPHRAVRRQLGTSQIRGAVLTSHPCPTHVAAAQNWHMAVRLWPIDKPASRAESAIYDRCDRRCGHAL